MSKLFEPFSLKSLQLKNRIVMPPMCMYSAGTDGIATNWHKTHYSSRAIGGAGLIIQEATAVERRGRLSDNDLGLWTDDQISGLSEIVDLVHEFGAKIALQLAHGGRKAWPGEENIVAPSPIKFSTNDTVPEQLSLYQISQVVENFSHAAKRAVKAGYDAIEIHAAHGYLIHEFISPHTNKRTDKYGGDKENRLNFPIEVIKAVKAVIPIDMPLLMRISAVEYLDDGYTFEDMIEAVCVFKKHGLDLIDVSSGGASQNAPPSWPGFQLPYAQKIKSEIGIPAIGCGLIREPQMAEEAVERGMVDLIAIGRGFLADPHWAIKASKTLNVDEIVPWQYERAFR